MKGKADKWFFWLLFFVITGAAVFMRLWRFRENGELIGDEAYFVNTAGAVFSRSSVWGWESLLRFNYGAGILLVLATWEKILGYLDLPFFRFDEQTLHLPQVLIGILIIWTAYAVVKKLTSTGPAFAVAASIAVMPMHVCLSRSITPYGMGPWLSLLSVYMILRWCEKESWHRALSAGLVLAACLQSDALQLTHLSFIPLLIGLGPAPNREPHASFKLERTVSLQYAGLLILFALFLHPKVLQVVMPLHAGQWPSFFLSKLEVYSSVIASYGLLILSLVFGQKRLRMPGKLASTWKKLIHPAFLIPATLSFLANLLVAIGSRVETGSPRGILGYSLAQKDLKWGFYLPTWIQDLATVCGWPVLIITLIGIAILPWTYKRARGLILLGVWATIANILWIVAVSPTYPGRDLTLTIASITLIALGLGSLWYGFDRFTDVFGLRRIAAVRPIIFALLVAGVFLGSVPYAMADITLERFLYAEPTGNRANHYGAIVPVTGSKEAFEYVRSTAGLNETVFSSFDKNVARFYLERPFPKLRKARVIGSFKMPHGAETARLFQQMGYKAEWYVVDASFSRKYIEGKVPGAKLRARVKGQGATAEVWQMDYSGMVEDLPVIR